MGENGREWVKGGNKTDMWIARLSKGSCKKGKKITKHRK